MSEVDGSPRKITVLVLAFFVVLVPGLLTAGCYYSPTKFLPPMSGDGTDSGTDSGGGSGPDADANNCFGTAPFSVCFDQLPTQPLSIPQQPIDTSNDTSCLVKKVAGTESCVLAGKTINVDTTLRATGSRPLVLVASETIMISGMVDVGSHRGSPPEVGAGARPSCASGQAPDHGGGGAGGSFMGLGGKGGTSTSGEKGGTSGPVATPTAQLRGGCPGQATGFPGAVAGGQGGGAVLLIAGSLISVSDTGAINAAGEGGEGGTIITGNGGGGGGSGGMIVLDARTVTSSGLILASGAGGGGGSSNGNPGGDGDSGADASAVIQAGGGGGGQPNGGDGGKGSTSAASAGGVDGSPGAMTTAGGYGGGGGGGTGIVIAPVGATLMHVSPVQTTTP